MLVECLASLGSYWSPVRKKGQTCRCQPVTLVREPFSSQFSSSPKVRSMKGVSFAMCRAEKARVWQTPQTLFLGRALFADAAVWSPPRNPVFIRNYLACFGSEQGWAEHWTTFAMPEEQTFALVQCLASLANWCGVRAAIQFISQYWRKGRHVGVSQWPLWESHPLPSFHHHQKLPCWNNISIRATLP